MDEAQRLSADIIDDVCGIIEEIYAIKPKPQEDIENPALICGEAYYELEDVIAEKIRSFAKKKK